MIIITMFEVYGSLELGGFAQAFVNAWATWAASLPFLILPPSEEKECS